MEPQPTHCACGPDDPAACSFAAALLLLCRSFFRTFLPSGLDMENGKGKSRTIKNGYKQEWMDKREWAGVGVGQGQKWAGARARKE